MKVRDFFLTPVWKGKTNIPGTDQFNQGNPIGPHALERAPHQQTSAGPQSSCWHHFLTIKIAATKAYNTGFFWHTKPNRVHKSSFYCALPSVSGHRRFVSGVLHKRLVPSRLMEREWFLLWALQILKLALKNIDSFYDPVGRQSKNNLPFVYSE